jgi:hypothetical protein
MEIMSYIDQMGMSHLYTVYFAPRGYARMANLGMRLAASYLSPFDKLIGLVGEGGSGKSMLVKGMFPGLELTNDDEGVNVRPLPILGVGERPGGFFSTHTYHIDVRFEAAFTQMHLLASSILEAINLGKRVVVEHFELIYPSLERNANLLIGVGEEVIITRPTIFGPEPQDIADIVFRSNLFRRMAHSAEDMCQLYLSQTLKSTEPFIHSDVRHGFVLGFQNKPSFALEEVEAAINEMIARDVGISYKDDNHIYIGDQEHVCTGPRIHVAGAGEIKKFALNKDFMVEPDSGRFLMIGIVGERAPQKIRDLNRIMMA